MTQGVDPNDIFHNGVWYNRSGGGGVVTAEVDPITGGISLYGSQFSMPLTGRKKSVMWLGDSLTQSGGNMRHPLQNHTRAHYLSQTFTNLNVNGLCFRYARHHPETPTGNGTLRYYAATDSITWQAFGDTEGAPVSFGNGGFLVVESGTANKTCYIACVSRFKPSANASDTINVTGTADITRCDFSGFTGWAEALLGCPFDDSWNYGLSGSQAVEHWLWKAQWENVFTDITVIHLGTNNTSDMTGAAAEYSALESIVKSRIAVGSKVVVCTLFPSNGMTAAQYGAKEWFRQKTMKMCADLGVDCADGWAYLANPLATDGSYRTDNVSDDGLHTSVKGSYIFAKKALVPILQKYVSSHPRPNAGVAYDATTAPKGNLLTNGVFTGTAGTKGTRVTGDIATSWTAGMVGGSVATCVATAPQSASPVARSDGFPGNWMRFTLSNSGGVNYEYLSLYQSAYVSASNYSAGDYLVAECEIQISSNGISNMTVGVSETTGKSWAINQSNKSAYDLDGDTVSVFVRSFPLLVETSSTNVQNSMNFGMMAGGSGVVDIAHSVIRKVDVT